MLNYETLKVLKTNQIIFIRENQKEGNQTNPKPKGSDEKQLTSEAGNENSVAILTAFAGCFVGIVVTSFIFLCCNPCHKLMKKRERHFSAVVSSFFQIIKLNVSYCSFNSFGKIVIIIVTNRTKIGSFVIALLT